MRGLRRALRGGCGVRVRGLRAGLLRRLRGGRRMPALLRAAAQAELNFIQKTQRRPLPCRAGGAKKPPQKRGRIVP